MRARGSNFYDKNPLISAGLYILIDWQKLKLKGPGPLVVNIIVNYCSTQKMLKNTKTDETIVFFCHIFIIGSIPIGRGPLGPPSGYAYALWCRARVVTSMRSKINFATTVNSKTKIWVYSALRIERTNRTG